MQMHNGVAKFLDTSTVERLIGLRRQRNLNLCSEHVQFVRQFADATGSTRAAM